MLCRRQRRLRNFWVRWWEPWRHWIILAVKCTCRLELDLPVCRLSVEEIHSVGTINNVETAYFTQLKMCYLMTTFRCLSEHKKEVDSFTAGTQTRASRARESSVTHKSAITDHVVDENHVIDWDKATVVDREAQRQTRWINEALRIRKTLICMNRDAGSYQLSHTWDQVTSRSRAPSRCKQSRRDQDVRRTSKRCH